MKKAKDLMAVVLGTLVLVLLEGLLCLGVAADWVEKTARKDWAATKGHFNKALNAVTYAVGVVVAYVLTTYDKLTSNVHFKEFRQRMAQNFTTGFHKGVQAAKVTYLDLGLHSGQKIYPPKYTEKILDTSGVLRNVVKIHVIGKFSQIDEFYEVEGGEYVVLEYYHNHDSNKGTPLHRGMYTKEKMIKEYAKGGTSFPYTLPSFVQLVGLAGEC